MPSSGQLHVPTMLTDDFGEFSHLDENGEPRIVERQFVVEKEYGGFRVDHYLKCKISRLSRTKVQKIVREQLTLNGNRDIRPNAVVQPGQVLVLRRPARAEPKSPRTCDIVYKDEHVLAVNKPAGLTVHSSARFYFNTLTRVISEKFPGEKWQLCHRLDRETSGLLLLAQGKIAARGLKTDFAERRIRKHYLAIVRGVPEWNEQFIDLPLGLSQEGVSVRMVVKSEGDPAQTEAMVVSRHTDRALIRCHPITGRQHQIRAHLAAVGYPLLGDKLYGQSDETFRQAVDHNDPEVLERLGFWRHALHAEAVEFTHPISGQAMALQTAMPDDMAKLKELS